MIGATEVEGKLTKVVVEDFKGPEGATFTTATIAGEEYPVAAERTDPLLLCQRALAQQPAEQ